MQIKHATQVAEDRLRCKRIELQKLVNNSLMADSFATFETMTVHTQQHSASRRGSPACRCVVAPPEARRPAVEAAEKMLAPKCDEE